MMQRYAVLSGGGMWWAGIVSVDPFLSGDAPMRAPGWVQDSSRDTGDFYDRQISKKVATYEDLNEARKIAAGLETRYGGTYKVHEVRVEADGRIFNLGLYEGEAE